MLKRLLCAAAVMVCFSTSAQALDGNRIMQLCEMNKKGCTFYAAGVASALMPLALASGCLPAGVSFKQGADILLRYIELNPAKRHIAVPNLFDAAMTEAYNCPPHFGLAYSTTEDWAKTKRAPK